MSAQIKKTETDYFNALSKEEAARQAELNRQNNNAMFRRTAETPAPQHLRQEASCIRFPTRFRSPTRMATASTL